MLRALPPAGVPITAGDLLAGLTASRDGEGALDAFRDDIRRTFGARHVFLASSGRGALSLLLRGLHALYPDRDAVALPAFTSFSVPSAVVNAGLKVTLYDVDPETLSPDPASLASALNGRTLAVVACHLYGYLADLDVVKRCASPLGIPVIDDAAQAMGAEFGGKAAGTCGDAGLFSLSRGKNITAVDGGIILTDRDDLAGVLEQVALADTAEGVPKLFLKAVILSALLRPSLYWLPRSLPFLGIGASVFDPEFPRAPFTPFQAGIARRMLARLPEITAARQRVADDLLAGLSGCSGLAVPRPVSGTRPVFLRFPLVVADDRPLREIPRLGIVRSYPAPLDAIPALGPFLVGGIGTYPGARRLADRLVSLPTNQFVTDGDRRRIVACCRERFQDE